MKSIILSVHIFNTEVTNYIIDNLPPAQRNIVRAFLERKEEQIIALQDDNRNMSEVFEKILDYGKRGRIHKVV